jgi:hypothetical protein
MRLVSIKLELLPFRGVMWCLMVVSRRQSADSLMCCISGGTAQEVGGPLDKEGAVGKQFTTEGSIGKQVCTYCHVFGMLPRMN